MIILCVPVQISKRGKVASRPSQQKQLEELQRQEREYVAMMKSRERSQETENVLSAATSTSGAGEDAESSADVSIPTQITDRMLRRMILFSIGPVFFGFLLFPAFYYLKKVQGIDIPVWAVYIVQTTIFAGGLLGISYGVVSSSWDPKREGSLLGWNEFQANLPLLLDRFRKTDEI